ncbi:hypothetical protein E5288_WYG019339 [Bos mutus]|uniref:KRAB domain-containing protein n=1 Tax=Bos mutus TaxID=72004 RepID=A0A6B0RD17_9CETA|nr:hypothetical protein [Bos mutus]
MSKKCGRLVVEFEVICPQNSPVMPSVDSNQGYRNRDRLEFEVYPNSSDFYLIGHPVSKPDVISKLEQGEDPWIIKRDIPNWICPYEGQADGRLDTEATEEAARTSSESLKLEESLEASCRMSATRTATGFLLNCKYE